MSNNLPVQPDDFAEQPKERQPYVIIFNDEEQPVPVKIVNYGGDTSHRTIMRLTLDANGVTTINTDQHALYVVIKPLNGQIEYAFGGGLTSGEKLTLDPTRTDHIPLAHADRMTFHNLDANSANTIELVFHSDPNLVRG